MVLLPIFVRWRLNCYALAYYERFNLKGCHPENRQMNFPCEYYRPYICLYQKAVYNGYKPIALEPIIICEPGVPLSSLRRVMRSFNSY